MNSEKTKAIKIGPEHHPPIIRMQQSVDYVETFPYIGRNMSSNGDSEPDVMLQDRKSCINFPTASSYHYGDELP